MDELRRGSLRILGCLISLPNHFDGIVFLEGVEGGVQFPVEESNVLKKVNLVIVVFF